MSSPHGNGNVCKLFSQTVLGAVVFLLCFLCCPVRGEGKTGSITVKNETGKTIYVVIDGYNKGEVWAHSSETWSVEVGEHRVQAYCGDKETSKYIKLTDTYPDGTWSVSSGDF